MTYFELFFVATFYFLRRFFIWMILYFLWDLAWHLVLDKPFAHLFNTSFSVCIALFRSLHFWMTPRKSFAQKRIIVEILHGRYF